MTDDFKPVQSRYSAAIDEARRRLVGQGWTFESEREIDVPGVGRFRPDYFARLGDQVIIGEVKYRGESSTSQLEQLFRSVNALPNASIEMTWLGELPKSFDPDRVLELASAATRILGISAAAALLTAWAALEGALAIDDSRLRREAQDGRIVTARQRLNERANLGLFSESQLNRLMSASKLRNSIAHGTESESPSAEIVEYVSSLASALVDAKYASIDEMIAWFFDHYKDPAEGVPYDGGEGGYLYFNGGPYDANDVLADEFDMMPWQDREEAAASIRYDGSMYWVRKEDY